MMIDKFFEYLDQGLSGQIEPFKFSIDLESYLVDNYDVMYLENGPLAFKAADEIPDITEQMEPGMDPAKFLNELRAIKEELLKMK